MCVCVVCGCVCVCVCVCLLRLCVVSCVCVCVCVSVWACKDLHRGQFCVFNHLTGDVRQGGRPRMFLQVHSTSYHILNMFDIFNAYFKN